MDRTNTVRDGSDSSTKDKTDSFSWKTLDGPLVETPKDSGRRLRGAILDHLGETIVTGGIAPGDKLPGEVETAEALNVSRGAYREAIKMLAAKGMVASRPKAGTRVLQRSEWNLLDPSVLRWAFAGHPDPDLVRDLFEMRAIVEPEIARLAALRRSEAHLDAMRAALETMRQDTLATQTGMNADRQFHVSMLDATGNQVMMSLGASISAAVAYTTMFKSRASGFVRDPVPDHGLVLAAIEEMDGEGAAGAMRELLDLAHQDTQQALADHAERD